MARRCLGACFCEKGDLLSQWRGYAGGTGGFAIGIDRDGLKNRTFAFDRNRWPGDSHPPSKPDLKPVVYGEEAGIAAVDEYIQSLMASDRKAGVNRSDAERNRSSDGISPGQRRGSSPLSSTRIHAGQGLKSIRNTSHVKTAVKIHTRVRVYVEHSGTAAQGR